MALVSRARAISDILAALAARAPFERAAEWDPVGLVLGDASAQVRKVAVCHEVTEAVVAALESDPVDLLVAYHPLLFQPTNRLVAGPTPEGRALRLVRAGIALGVVHTSFDVAPGGTADALADALRLADVGGFAPLYGAPARKLVTFVPSAAADAVLDAVAEAGAARIGNYTHCSFRAQGTGTFFAREGAEPRAGPAYDLFERRGEARPAGRIGQVEGDVSLAELAERVREALQGPVPRVAGDPEMRARRVAVLPGSGEDFLRAARDAGADVLVSGDLRHHAVRRALDSGLASIDAGHAATERPGVERLLALVAAQGLPTAGLLDLDADGGG